ncbi:MAG: hypothetical protein Q9169_008342 [Polycauliona sp. 2 TL-2023]
MATGIEIAGMTLAAFPIVIDGLAHFVEGVRIIDSWRTFRYDLASYQHGLRCARAFFQNTVEELLEGIASQEYIIALRGSPDRLAAPNPLYEEQLKTRLDHDYDNCLEAMTRIRKAIEILVGKLNLDPAGKTIWDDRITIKREVRRLKLVLSKKAYKALLAEIDKANQDLLARTQQGRRLEPSRSKRQSSQRMVNPTVGRRGVSFAMLPVRPSYPATRPQTSQSSRNAAIEDICTAIGISAAAQSDTERCLGFLSDKGESRHRHDVFLVHQAKVLMARKSLQELLQDPKQRRPGQGMSWKASLCVAATLASSLIQLDGTGWLKQQWDSADVIFLTQDYTQPYLCWGIQPMNSRADDVRTLALPRQIRCRALTSLGVTLVEYVTNAIVLSQALPEY